jgi:hypothetical protein
MIEKTILDYLNSQLTVPAYMEIPADPPETFVLVERTSGSMENRIYHALFAVQSYAPTLYEAAGLNETVRDAMLSAVVLEEIASVRLNSDYNYTDTSTKQYRYQGVYDVVHY